ncbi:efflux RND transporter periplasmic adaptor subunit [Alteromonas sp. D210916BOD_24]|uniref:efflux RND transporter periplasmic adaptor subunit n=1 Tax=Alteromonas sp. D210916BOD_24 TaxID=3157618 RepID=UPI00399C9714
MTAVQNSDKGGQRNLFISIVIFFIALIVLLVTAGFGNATHSPEARVPMVVSTASVKIQDGFETPINVFGLVESPKTTSLSFDMNGQVNVLYVDEGARVSKGDKVAQLDVQRLKARKKELEASLARAKADAALAQINQQRTQTLVDKNLESAQRLDEVKAALNIAKAQVSEIEAALDSLLVDVEKATLVAPFDGTVNQRFLDEGSVVSASSPIIGITSTENYQARFAVPADIVAQFDVDQQVKVRVGDHAVPATVTQRLPVRNVQTRTVDILVTLSSNTQIRPGDMAILTGFRTHHEKGSWLPVNALSNGLRGLWRVFVLVGEKDNKLEARIVEVVYTDGSHAFVRGALKEGEHYVTEGTHKLAPGQMVSLQQHTPAGAR